MIQIKLNETIEAGNLKQFIQRNSVKTMIPHPVLITKVIAAIDGAKEAGYQVGQNKTLNQFTNIIQRARRQFSRLKVPSKSTVRKIRSIKDTVQALHDLSIKELHTLSIERVGNRIAIANPEYGNHAKHLSQFVLHDVQTQKNTTQKTKIFEFWLKTAKQLEDRGDLNSACAIYSAVGSLERVENKAFRNIASKVKNLVGNIDDKTINAGTYKHYMENDIVKDVIPYPLVFTNIIARIEGALQLNDQLNHSDTLMKFNRIIDNAKKTFPQSDAMNTSSVDQILTSLHQETNHRVVWTQILTGMSDKAPSPIVLSPPEKHVAFNEEVVEHEYGDLDHQNPTTKVDEDVLMESTHSENTLGDNPPEREANSVKSKIEYFEQLSKNKAAEQRQSYRNMYSRLKSEQNDRCGKTNETQTDENRTKQRYT